MSTSNPNPRPSFHTPLPLWDVGDYAAIGDTSLEATQKLRSSAVAPLVAQARGYESIDVQDKDRFDGFTQEQYGQSGTKPANNVKRIANGADLLFIPQYEMTRVAERRDSSQASRPKDIYRQFRPTRPAVGKDGKRKKYEFEAGSPTIIDVHPATPREYFYHPAFVLVTEGVIKADAVVTAYLQAHGIDRSRLAALGEADDPDRELHDMMLEIDEDERLLVVGISGVHNWHQNTEWSVLDLRPSGEKQTQAWVAFDGDLAENRHVWDATSQILNFLAHSKKVGEDNTRIVDLAAVDAPHGDKVGIDDFLAGHGTFADIVGLLTPDLPPRPEPPIDASVGKYRMNETGTALEYCVAGTDDYPAHWTTQVNIGGRVKSMSSSRAPMPREEAEWKVSEEVDAAELDTVVEIEIAWLAGTEVGDDDVDPATADIVRRTIKGPSEILGQPPRDWYKNGAAIPPDVLGHVDWPPPAKVSEEWLRALKGHASERKIQTSTWSTMGWVPTDVQDDPVFIVGDQALDASGLTDRVKPGVGERQLTGATSLAVTPVDPSLPAEERRARIKEAAENVLETFLVDSPWQNRDIGALMLAAALRPTLPLKPYTTIYLVGQAGSGKALPVDAEIPVPACAKFPNGTAHVGDIEPGDEVFGSNGEATRVRTTTDVHREDAYALTTGDGRAVTVSGRHLFKVSTAASRRAAERGAGRSRSTAALARALRFTAAGMSSGESGRLNDIAAAHGLSADVVARAAFAARVPSMSMLAPTGPESSDDAAYAAADVAARLGSMLDAPIALAGDSVTADELASTGLVARMTAADALDGLVPDRSPRRRMDPATVYPVAEVLAATADLLECGVTGSAVREFTATAAELAAMPDTAGLEIEPLRPTPPAVRRDSRLRRQGAVAGTAGKAGRRVAIPTAVLRGPAADRLAYLDGFTAAARPDEAVTVPDEHHRVVRVADAPTRRAAADLMRSVGLSPLASADGHILFREDPEPLRIVSVEPLGEQQAVKCLTVEAGDGMFAAGDFVPTHNSWTAATAMLFWEDGNTFNENQLPGSAQDTIAATEHAVSKAPIWVVDDLAPSSDGRKASIDQDRIGTFIRSIFNSSGKRRNSASGEQREQRRPKALLIATAENELPVASVMNRTITVRLAKNSMESEGMSRITQGLRKNDDASTVTAELIRYIAGKDYLIGPDGVGRLGEYWDRRRDMLTEMVSVLAERHGIPESVFKRQAQLTADLLVIIEPLNRLCLENGVRPDLVERLKALGPNTVGQSVFDLSVDSHQFNRESNPGQSLMRALASILESGREAHIGNAVNPTQPPITAGSALEGNEQRMNQRLGWSYRAGEAVANGEQIGAVIERQGKVIIVFQPNSAFRAAQRAYPNLVPPGSTADAAWRGVWESGLGVEGQYGIGFRQSTGKSASAKRNSLQISISGDRVSGIPVLLDSLLATEGLADDDHEDDELD